MLVDEVLGDLDADLAVGVTVNRTSRTAQRVANASSRPDATSTTRSTRVIGTPRTVTES